MIRHRLPVRIAGMIAAALIGGHDGIEPLGVEIEHINRMA